MKKLIIASLISGTLLVFSSYSVYSADILFAHVDDYGGYVDDGNRIAQFLANDGHNVSIRHLDQAIYTDYSSFDQIFVYDLYSGFDNNSNQMANYGNIASWYNNLADKNLILDGRIISSDVAWTNSAGMPSEEGWIQNYADQLDLRGGGLVLGTDHDAYHSGINTIVGQIGVDLFHGNYYTHPLQAVVDKESPLYIPGLHQCGPDIPCINDNSSTGFAATGLQSNGQTLTPVAYHGTTSTAWDNAAVSSTMGSITFGTCGGPNQPPCSPPSTIPEPSTMLLFGLGLAGLARFKSSRRAKE